METQSTKRRKSFRISPGQVIPLSFLALILFGTLLLMLPFAAAPGGKHDFVTALFTATTSVCVTGLVVVDTYSNWSLFGHLVILFLIQIGGLGVITVTYLLLSGFRKRRFSLSDRILVQNAVGLDTTIGLFAFIRKVVAGTFFVEGIGALLSCFVLVPEFGLVGGIWRSVFHAISAFCNAGIDIIGPDSMARYAENPLMLITTMMLIVLGGLGFVVWFDLIGDLKTGIRKHFSVKQIFKRAGEHTRLVLLLNLVLIFGGGLLFFLLEWGNPDTFAKLSPGGQVLGSLFQSVTLRTAGFTVPPQGNFRDTSLLVSYLLMFIGGSPIGTAGGIKTVTFFLMMLNVLSYIQGKDEIVLFKRKISEELMRKASAITGVSFIVCMLMTLLLMVFEPVGLRDALFEVISALATVGLTRGLTPQLHVTGRLLIVLCMYLGRIGPISMALFFVKAVPHTNRISFPEGNYHVG